MRREARLPFLRPALRRIRRSPLVRSIARPAGPLLRSLRKRAMQRREARDVLEEFAPYLVPGRWYTVLWQKRASGRGKVWALAHESVHSAGEHIASLRLDGGSSVRREPVMSVRPRRGREVGLPLGAHVVIPRPKKHGKTLLFDLEAGRVLRSAPSGFSTDYERVRDAFSRHVSSVSFTVLPGRDAIVEPLLRGAALRQTPVERAVPLVCEILDQLPGLLEEASRTTSHDLLEATLIGSRSDPESRRWSGEIIEWLGRAPLVPAHGDLVPVNILDEAVGPVCIDFGDAGERPAWSDVLQLAGATRRLFALEGSDEYSERLEDALRQALARVTRCDPPDAWQSSTDRLFGQLFGRAAVIRERRQAIGTTGIRSGGPSSGLSPA